MALAVREPHDLVLERRAVARADAADLTVEERRLADVLPHELVDPVRRVQQVTINLLAADLVGRERERHGRIVAALGREPRKVDAAAIEPRRRAGLQTSPGEPERFDRLGKISRGRFAGAARRPLIAPDVDQPVQKRPRGHDERAASVLFAALECQPRDAPAVDQKPSGAAHYPRDVRLRVQSVVDPLAVAPLVGLRARRPDGGTTTAIEQLELDPGGVDRRGHQAAERVDLAHQVALRRATDRRVAGHVRNRRFRQRTDRYAAAHPRRGPGRLDAGMAGADDDHVKVCDLQSHWYYKLLFVTEHDFCV